VEPNFRQETGASDFSTADSHHKDRTRVCVRCRIYIGESSAIAGLNCRRQVMACRVRWYRGMRPIGCSAPTTSPFDTRYQGKEPVGSFSVSWGVVDCDFVALLWSKSVLVWEEEPLRFLGQSRVGRGQSCSVWG